MAKILFGMMMTDARGKLGGQVFSKNNAGAYVRTKVSPVNPQSTYQTGVRSIFGSLSQGWGALTDDQRSAWNSSVDAYKRSDVFGTVRASTGKALYQRVNQNLLNAGLTAVDTPPATFDADPVTLVSVSFTVTGQVAEIATSGDSTGGVIQAWATPVLSPGTSFVKNLIRAVAYVTGGSDVTATISTAYSARFGAFAAGANIKAGFRVIYPDGRATPIVLDKATVTP